MRAKYQVLIIPFRKEKDNVKFGIFKREDMNIYQAISGGGEDGETILETAKREFYEETGLKKEKFIKLDSICTIPAYIFKAKADWEDKTYVVPEYAFGIELTKNDKIILSNTAIYELNERIKKGDCNGYLE